MKKNNIVLFCTEFHFLKIFFIDQAKNLSKFGHVYIVCSMTDDEFNSEFSDFENIFHFKVKVGRKISLFDDVHSFFKVIGLLISKRPILAQSIFPKSGFLGMLTSFLCFVPVRSHIFTGQVWANRTGLKRKLLKLADIMIAFCATDVLADGASQMKFLIKEKVINPSKISVLGKGSISGVETTAAKEERKYDDNKDITCIYFGRLTHEKGFDVVLETFEYFKRNRIDIKLIVIGADEDNFKEEIKKLTNIKYMGFVESPPEYIKKSDVLLLPSHREGFGSVVIEAGSLGVPCIGSNIYGLSDALIDNFNGLKLKQIHSKDLAALILRLNNDKQFLQELSQNAKRYADENFNKTLVLRNWENYFNNLIKRY